jgi:hypothetical protein
MQTAGLEPGAAAQQVKPGSSCTLLQLFNGVHVSVLYPTLSLLGAAP